MGRITTAPVTIVGQQIPAGVLLLVSLAMIQQDPRVWGPDAHEFRPERHLDEISPSYGWVPFGGGTRRCVGAAFAQVELDTVLRTVLQDAPGLRPARRVSERVKVHRITTSPARGTRVVWDFVPS